MIKRICIFCSSSDKIDPAHFDAAEKIAFELTKAGCVIVCGGGSHGLMGKIIETSVKNGGYVIGVIPEFMRTVEWDSKDLNELIVVEDMRERKKRMIENADAIIALAGGCGTLEELMEVITLKRLGKFTKPIIILNTNGFYNHLKELLDKMINENFMNKQSIDIWKFIDSPEQIFDAISNAAQWDSDAIKFAVV
ncbi:MAG: TIGR00730 family Rossman fold protein [Prevotellaceae bacterium]|nr:TIGR00730 family Rossman fold protein [Prevotellaceae bacterium]